jgi:UDPglucose 6-dehydrogenase
MKICILGTGYVGLVTGTCLADVGNAVVCVDKNVEKIQSLREGKSPIYEPRLEAMICKNLKSKSVQFTSDLAEGLSGAKVCFLCVDTPPRHDGHADLTNLSAAATEIGEKMEGTLAVAIKSTVPLGTVVEVKKIIQNVLRARSMPIDLIHVASNPEFLKEGDAVEDFLKPSHVVVGTDSENIAHLFHEIYLPFMRKRDCFLVMDIASSELTKYACNAMLATRISFMNQLAQLSEKIGANISRVRTAMGHDSRIGPDFLYPGIGYGGSCFPKDVKALVQTAKMLGMNLEILEVTDQINERQKVWFWDKIHAHYNGQMRGLKIAIWGGAFKPNTDDIRSAPALYFVDRLLESEATVILFDPVAIEKLRDVYGDRITFAPTNYACLEGADGLIVATEWGEFRSPDFEKMKCLMRSAVIFDGRNLYEGDVIKEHGFQYHGVGV